MKNFSISLGEIVLKESDLKDLTSGDLADLDIKYKDSNVSFRLGETQDGEVRLGIYRDSIQIGTYPLSLGSPAIWGLGMLEFLSKKTTLKHEPDYLGRQKFV